MRGCSPVPCSTLTVRDVPANQNIECTAQGEDGVSSGEFQIDISCTSDSPTASPSNRPTTDAPTTFEPTTTPTKEPSESPTTPAPTHPGELICGSTYSGEYDGESYEFEVRMPHAGDMTVNAGGDDFEVAYIACYDSDGNQLDDADSASESLTVHDLPANTDYTCSADFGLTLPGDASGSFTIEIECTSDAPTRAPTAEPSSEPTATPTTPAPIHPGELVCGSHTSGAYNGEPVEFEVQMPHEGDMTVDAGGSDFEIGAITCYDSDGNELRDMDATPSSLMVHDVPGSEDITCVLEGAPFFRSGFFYIEI